MIAYLKPYPVYKDSGIPWLGRVPEQWGIIKLRSILRGVAQRNRPDLPLLSVVREKGVILRDVMNKDENHNFVPDDLTNYKAVRKGQFVMNKMKAWQGSYGVSHYDGIVSPAYFVFEIGEVDTAYFNVAIRSRRYIPFFIQASDGVRIAQWDLSQTRMREIPFVIPPLLEQPAIVRYLDYMDRRIGRYIRAKQKLIKLLNEQKQAIIHQAVTRGLDPNVRLKPSGVEWLGNVPEHWGIERISHFACVGNGSTPSRAKPVYWDGGTYPWLNSSQVHRGLIRGTNQFVTQTALDECHLPKVPAGSVLVAITGQGKTRGMSAVLGIEATINQHLAFITPLLRAAISSEYLHLALSGAYLHLRALSEDSGSTKGAITCEDLKYFKIAVPPRREQEVLVWHVGTKISGLTTGVDRSQREIALMQDYRTRLIADVVTGKLDVREAAAQLPDETEESEIAEEIDAISDDIEEPEDVNEDDLMEEA